MTEPTHKGYRGGFHLRTPDGFPYRTVQREWGHGYEYPNELTPEILARRQAMDHERYGHCASWFSFDAGKVAQAALSAALGEGE